VHAFILAEIGLLIEDMFESVDKSKSIERPATKNTDIAATSSCGIRSRRMIAAVAFSAALGAHISA